MTRIWPAHWQPEARIIVTRDEDLLVLEKPFGIHIITPRLLLTRLSTPL